MHHEFFKPTTFAEGMDTVVGGCNGFTKEERWAAETPIFAQAILDNLPGGATTLVDYGCGIGRIAKELLSRNAGITVIGVDASDAQLQFAREYVDSPRFVAMQPHELDTHADLIYSIYVLQHVPAVEIRDMLQRIHYYLKDDAKFVYCSSDYRMAIRFDRPEFMDDSILGVDLPEELCRYFIKEGDLFSPEVLNDNPLVRGMVTGDDGTLLAHPAYVFRKRIEQKPLFNYLPTP